MSRPRRRMVPLALAAVALAAVPAVASAAGEIALENRDGLPFADHLSFNRVGSTNGYPVHDVVVLRVLNQSATPLTISGLSVTGPFALNTAIGLPATVPANGFLDVPVRYTATTAGSPVAARHSGRLTITSSDDDEPVTQVALEGVWQVRTGGEDERALDEIVSVFGYETLIGTASQVANRGRVEAIGDEVLSPYWKRLDTTKPVTVRQIAAFAGTQTADFRWYAKGNTFQRYTAVVRTADDYHQLFPRNSAKTGPAQASFTPASTVFGFRVKAAWSDPTLNTKNSTCVANGWQCGHYLRFWPARDKDGRIMTGQYIVGFDNPNGNNDYQDEIYLLQNVTPEIPAVDTTAPAVTTRTPAPGAGGVASGTPVTVGFSEAIAFGSATTATARILRDGAPLAATVDLSNKNRTLTIDPAADLAPGAVYTVELTGLTDEKGNALPATSWTFATEGVPPVAGGAFQFQGGQAVIEAENADSALARAGRSWQIGVGPAGSVGQSMTARPLGATIEAADALTSAPELRYRVDFPTAGTYRVWTRGYAPSSSSNSLHVGIDNVIAATSDNIGTGTTGAWAWLSGSAGGPNPATISVPTAGVHTVSVYAREQGISVDRLVIAPTGSTPAGEGPAESPRGTADTTPPSVVATAPADGATGVAPGAPVVVDFSEEISPGSVSETSVVLSRAGTPVAATRTLSAGGTRLTVTPTAPLPDGASMSLRLEGIADEAGNTMAAATVGFQVAGLAPYRVSGGQVVMEAENADESIARSGQSWQAGVPAGAVGGGMAALADTGAVYEAATAPSAAPELRFRVDFPGAGTYRVHLRGNAPNTAGNSAHVGLDGALTTTSDAITLPTYGAWTWFAGSTGGPSPATIAVPSAGVHTVNVWPREDGIAIDRVVLTQGAAPTGDGPAESARG